MTWELTSRPRTSSSARTRSARLISGRPLETVELSAEEILHDDDPVTDVESARRALGHAEHRLALFAGAGDRAIEDADTQAAVYLLNRLIPARKGTLLELAGLHPVRDAHGAAEAAARILELVAAGDRDALLLHARDGLSYDEVARRLHISVGAVKSRVFRARQALAVLRGEGDEP